MELTELVDAGVLYLANESFFWPLGLALAWEHDPETKTSRDLHIRQWEYPDGHRETILDLSADGVGLKRHAAFFAWVIERMRLMPADERAGGLSILGLDRLPDEDVDEVLTR